MKAHIDDIVISNCQAIATQLRGVYMPWYKELALSYSDTRKGTGKLIREQQERMALVMRLIARVQGVGGTPITEREFKELTKFTGEIREVHRHISKVVEASAPLLEDTEKALENIGITPKELTSMTSILKKKQEKRSRSRDVGRGALSQLGFGRMSLLGLGGIITQQAAKFAGPYGGPAMALGGAIAGGYMGIRALRKRRAKKAFTQSGGISGISGLPGDAGVSGATGIPGLAGAGVMEGVPATYPRDTRGRFTPRGGLTGIDNTEKALFKFFNTRAMKAKWTRNMLRATEKQGKSGAGVIGGLLGSFGKLKLGILALLPLLGKGAGLAGAIAFTTIQLYRASKVAKEWWEVHKEAAKSIKKQNELSMGFLENLSDTLMKKGDVKGVIETQREILKKEEKSGLWSSWKQGAKGITGSVKGVVGFEDGGLITKPTIGLLGEKHKPEVVTPLSSGNVMDVLKAIKENTARAMEMTAAPIDTFKPPFDLADPLLNQLNMTGSLNLG